ncbi:MAG: lysoplasmalogenase [Oscillospiraceae bacterium]|jgi:uncharacterized membrane protein YhhN|nr:lysoplasmalogenase [Oscillospiraceae bacterium]
MILPYALGLCGVVMIVLQPLRFVAKPDFAGFGSKTFASLLFCVAGVAAAGRRETVGWQAAAVLMGFCLALIGDVLLSIEPILARPAQDKSYALVLGGVPFLLAHGLNLAVFCSRAAFDWRLLPVLLAVPALLALLWKCGVLQFGKAGVPVLVYALLLGAMLWAACGVFGADKALGRLVLPAAALFCVSDIALFWANFGKKDWGSHFSAKKPFLWLVMVPYYVAQALLAGAVATI